ncbi:hypothetical protein SAMN02745975_00314 [Geosporobacter subterraneus DSM 17957]|uniref:Uncharacterized protein n=1 Tax=Geosporobacter subterraneus DSM 17957 TaxID=1121919 RepID=A0A1M6CSW5_9FIRM|nr:hypothetical protein [Geosporobacter subterraneus]SHI63951.1 hypothetical protein SAMN02745975_00314 [Geosporobacter subterraneus DSM 17957]
MLHWLKEVDENISREELEARVKDLYELVELLLKKNKQNDEIICKMYSELEGLKNRMNIA